MAKVKEFSVSMASGDVVYTTISTSKDGYNYARIVAEKGKEEYLSVSYEWRGGSIPGFVMDLMGFIKSNNSETSGVWEGKEEVYKEYCSKDIK